MIFARVPEHIRCAYLIFLRDNGMAQGVENYYDNPSQYARYELLFRMRKALSQPLYANIKITNDLLVKILDPYNTTRPILCADDTVADVDIDDEVIDRILGKIPKSKKKHSWFVKRVMSCSHNYKQ